MTSIACANMCVAIHDGASQRRKVVVMTYFLTFVLTFVGQLPTSPLLVDCLLSPSSVYNLMLFLAFLYYTQPQDSKNAIISKFGHVQGPGEPVEERRSDVTGTSSSSLLYIHPPRTWHSTIPFHTIPFNHPYQSTTTHLISSSSNL